MQRDSHPPRWLAVIALALGITACERSASRHPERDQDVEEDEREPSDAAKASFAEVTKRYAAAKAKGALSKTQCEDLAHAFEDVFDKHGKTMPIAKFNAAAVREECGQVEAAAELYRELTQEAPKLALAFNNLGVIHWNRRQETQALELFQRAVKADPTTSAPRNNLAALLRERYAETPEQRAFLTAENEIQSVLALDSNNRLAYENLARLYYDRGRLVDESYLLLAQLVVTQALAKAKAGSLTESADIRNIEGLVYIQGDNQIEALRAFKQAVAIDGRHSDAHMNIALVAIRFRDYTTAERSLEIAIADRRQQTNVEAYLGLGVAQRGLRKYGDAEKSFKKAIEVRSSDPRALYNLGILYHEHIGPEIERKNKTDAFDERPYATAKQYFEKFVAQSTGVTALAKPTNDARQRVTSIDKYFDDIKQMKALEKQMQRMQDEERKQIEKEKERLRGIEDELKRGP